MGLTIFYILAAVSIISALGVVFNKNVVYSALLLLVNFCTLSFLYFMLNAQFLGVVQVLVYAGAIVVLFLFVVMLLGDQLGEEVSTWLTPHNAVMGLLGALLLTMLGTVVFEGSAINGQKGDFTADLVATHGQSQLIGGILFTDHFISVQLAGLLLLVGVVGVIWLARLEKKPTETNDNALSVAVNKEVS